MEAFTVATCINLQELCGDLYRIGHDEAAQTRGERVDPWTMTVPCQRGVIYPCGGDLLAVEVDYHPSVAKQLAALPGVGCVQDGDQEKTFTFPSAKFDAVAAVVKPRKRKQVSVEERARLVDMGKQHRFGRMPTGRGSEISDQRPKNAPSGDQEAA
jgi:hypothetical protein